LIRILRRFFNAEAIMKCVYLAMSVPLLCWVVGCATPPYVDGYYYSPRPLVADIPSTQPALPPPVKAYASVVGIRNQDDTAHVPLSIEVRLRVDNNGPESVVFNPTSMELNTGDLFRFGPPLVATAPVALTPGESAMVTAYFPFPAGKSYDDFDLGSLQLRWALQIGAQSVEQIGDFRQEIQQVYYYRDDPYWGPYRYGPRPYIGGVVVVHRR
jgi:hypothetical protein